MSFDFEKWLAGRCELLHGDEVRPLIEAARAIATGTIREFDDHIELHPPDTNELYALRQALHDLGVLDE